ncbi:hypothetical protein DPMN_025590 [Dreissena polymorpha]|uniref:Uncharacterized protein n=1 Tax=Dreissena polymorpha TaxID=45954 RepID=A0A9D4RDS2_DREPO|nr:hypothetical protein DPMN_025521 [Dreissena polymorpha]KAH3862620.1 hypothetical protein DPMN_025590 [Dreissena polymorpha]
MRNLHDHQNRSFHFIPEGIVNIQRVDVHLALVDLVEDQHEADAHQQQRGADKSCRHHKRVREAGRAVPDTLRKTETP